MPFTLTQKDLSKLNGVHPDLVRVIVRAATLAPFRFRITEGMRTLERQKQLVAQGKSWTMNSRHLTGHAVDLVPYIDYDKDGDIDGNDLYAWPLYYKLAPIIKEAAKIEGVKLDWGGDWKSKKDGPHWQLNWKAYPIDGVKADKTPATETEIEVAKGAGVVGVAATMADPVKAVIDSMVQNEAAFTSGDVAQTIFAAVIALGSGFYIWARSK